MAWSVENILEAVKKIRGVPVTQLLSLRGPKSVSWARQEAYYLMRHHTEKSYPEIGQVFGGRDHTTIMHGVRKIERLCDCNPKYRSEVTSLEVEANNQWMINPDLTLETVDEISPPRSALRILGSIEMNNGNFKTSSDEIFMMAAAIDKIYDTLTDLSGNETITDDDLNTLFHCLHHPNKAANGETISMAQKPIFPPSPEPHKHS